jgi:queuosine precursor transporter
MPVSVVLLWTATVGAASALSAWYIRRYDRADLAVGLYVIYLAMAQLLATKFVSFDLGLFRVDTIAAVLIFPFTYQLIDIVNEAYGRVQTQRMILIAFVSQVFMVAFILMGTLAPPASFWRGHEAWRQTLGMVPRITGASWVAFLISQSVDNQIFSGLRKATHGRHLWLRNVASDVPALALDSVLFVSLAFWGTAPVWPIMLGQLVMKTIIGLIDAPFMYLSHWIMKSEAPQASSSE